MFKLRSLYDFYLKNSVAIIMLSSLPILFIGFILALNKTYMELGLTIALLSLLYFTLATIFVSYRNSWVYNQRIKVIDMKGDFYSKLPSYEYMLATLWIWDVNKYLK